MDTTIWQIIEETLTDGSTVYAVANSEYKIDCADNDAAHELWVLLDRVMVDCGPR